MAMGRSANLWVYFFLIFLIWTLTSSALTEAPNDGCADGTYQHEGVTCCLCGPGQKVLKHCTRNPNDGDCGFCEEGKTYREEPTSETTCEPCDSCSHPNANLEVVEQCTTSRNSKCGCQKDYYCDSKESCVVCHSCKTCESTGVKIACNGTSNTVCNDSKGGSAGTIAGIIIPILIILGVIGGILYWKKKKGKTNGEDEPDSEELEYLNEVNIEPHLSDIAQVLGWKDMRYIARKSEISNTVIETCKLNHPNDTEESTFELLKTWLEKTGSSGLRSLVQILQKSGKKQKKERILNLVRPDANNESSNPV
ncbi:tumor necrosis factor receptor superfamily member 6 [Oryzias melastigma]|uniref:tumor necrosis factor receptor superfamily member 6 n=1 Tax=Oryzias melastigma TaxID=30732 RepID=UPI000CF8234B|nr:tumor necrosis factor receptor superfamily member 6 [Oryzias melastigma]